MGRPKQAVTPVSDELFVRMKIAALRAGVSKNAWMRAAFEEKLARDERPKARKSA